MRHRWISFAVIGVLLTLAFRLEAATVTKGKTFTSTEQVTNTKLHSLVDDATVTAIVSADITDGTIATADVADNAVTTAKISDNTITAADLASTLTMADGDFLDFSASNASSTTDGIRLPQATSCALATAEGQFCWDSDNDVLRIGSSASAIAVTPHAYGAILSNGAIEGTAFNISSVSDTGIGVATVTMTTALPATTGAMYFCSLLDTGAKMCSITQTSSSVFVVRAFTDAGTAADPTGNYAVSVWFTN